MRRTYDLPPVSNDGGNTLTGLRLGPSFLMRRQQLVAEIVATESHYDLPSPPISVRLSYPNSQFSSPVPGQEAGIIDLETGRPCTRCSGSRSITPWKLHYNPPSCFTSRCSSPNYQSCEVPRTPMPHIIHSSRPGRYYYPIQQYIEEQTINPPRPPQPQHSRQPHRPAQLPCCGSINLAAPAPPSPPSYSSTLLAMEEHIARYRRLPNLPPPLRPHEHYVKSENPGPLHPRLYRYSRNLHTAVISNPFQNQSVPMLRPPFWNNDRMQTPLREETFPNTKPPLPPIIENSSNESIGDATSISTFSPLPPPPAHVSTDSDDTSPCFTSPHVMRKRLCAQLPYKIREDSRDTPFPHPVVKSLCAQSPTEQLFTPVAPMSENDSEIVVTQDCEEVQDLTDKLFDDEVAKVCSLLKTTKKEKDREEINKNKTVDGLIEIEENKNETENELVVELLPECPIAVIKSSITDNCLTAPVQLPIPLQTDNKDSKDTICNKDSTDDTQVTCISEDRKEESQETEGEIKSKKEEIKLGKEIEVHVCAVDKEYEGEKDSKEADKMVARKKKKVKKLKRKGEQKVSKNKEGDNSTGGYKEPEMIQKPSDGEEMIQKPSDGEENKKVTEQNDDNEKELKTESDKDEEICFSDVSKEVMYDSSNDDRDSLIILSDIKLPTSPSPPMEQRKRYSNKYLPSIQTCERPVTCVKERSSLPVLPDVTTIVAYVEGSTITDSNITDIVSSNVTNVEGSNITNVEGSNVTNVMGSDDDIATDLLQMANTNIIPFPPYNPLVLSRSSSILSEGSQYRMSRPITPDYNFDVHVIDLLPEYFSEYNKNKRRSCRYYRRVRRALRYIKKKVKNVF